MPGLFFFPVFGISDTPRCTKRCTIKMNKLLVVIFAFLLLSVIGSGFWVSKNLSKAAEEKVADDRLDIQSEKNKETEKKENISRNNPEVGHLPQPESKIKFSFAILGDTQSFKPSESGGYQSAVSNIEKLNPDLVFALGDLVSSCDKTAECEGKLNDWRSVLGPLASKTYPTQGNHDRTGGEKADVAWKKVFSYLPENGPDDLAKFVYSFDRENSHFVVLASDKPQENDITGAQLDWLEADLAKNQKNHIFVFFHEPAYPTNSKIGESLDKNPSDRDRLWSILTKHKVRAVFSGHEHIQSRRKVAGLYQFEFGNTESFDHLAPKSGNAEYFHIGQAFGFVEVIGKDVTIKTYSVQGDLLDFFSFSN